MILRETIGALRWISPFHTRLPMSASRGVSNPIPATFLRGGTSKGIFLNRLVLPTDQSKWDSIFLGLMGSPDPEYGRQLNGMGGGISSLSKICVVGSPSPAQKEQGIQAEYTFVQVGIRDSAIDYSGNCGNLSSMIGVFAVDEGICDPPPHPGTHATIRTFNTNTQKVIDTTFPVSDQSPPTAVLELQETHMAGVPEWPLQSASYIDAANPTVFIDASELHPLFPVDEFFQGKAHQGLEEALEAIRQQGAMVMGLDPSAQAQPKIALLDAPGPETENVDIVIHALSMGVLHKAVPMTVGLGLGAAANIKGTVAMKLIRIQHPSGTVDVGSEFLESGELKNVKVVRTGRRLMKGFVWW
ncbi:hypothetical protein BD779DRAFT_1663184 [Infundibulicybe gibba]|nr:hypothetical protein BD779DRAFT_1663184 [Infundibulicybe gibba]